MKVIPLLVAAFGTVAAAKGGKDEGPAPSDIFDDKLARYSLLGGGCVLAFFLIWHAVLRFMGHIRHLTNLNNDTQRYFIPAHPFIAWFKKSIVYAPLFRKRHNREFKLSSAVNMGTLPTRFQTLLLVGIIATNVTLCCITIPFPAPEKTVLGLIRNRSGTMATVNLVPLVIMAGRNNPLIKLLGVSFDTWNLLHRWFARIVVLETLTHVLAWMINKVHNEGWEAVTTSFAGQFIQTGLIATVAFVILAVHSPSAIRHAFYETFLHIHIAMVAVSFGFLWVHLKKYPQRRFLLAAIVAWAVDRGLRFVLIAWRNFGSNGGTSALVEVLPGEAMRITLRMARPWTFKPGQHLYLYIPAVGFWMSHPFTAAWSDSEELANGEKGLVTTQQDVSDSRKENISLIVRRRTGFTNKLYEKANERIGGRLSLNAFVEGPYGLEESLDSYGTVMLFAAGVGITHHVPYARHLVEGYAAGTVAARRVTLVWIIQAPEHLEWIRPWMTTILSMERRREVLRIMLFITRPRNTKEIHSPSATVQMFPGKPNIQTLIDGEIEKQIGAMGVLVCGTGSLADDVRGACRKRQYSSSLDFVEESFTW
ncbi:hypothetical protein AJ80_03992 [Polytolypa hystricis UAMH7299]|uniref:ferric-chelate reductase (NADPH) n=1 Tax=Polytolypa hystricis (strain UAMH7299) TaxID=1447883 RepID=A0A2B7YEP5_POLH7|nr:hypothetical protein AJ80_03992 [Polytolypa hystricis UAMH7299]